MLNEAKMKLKEVEDGIETLQATFKETSAKKEELANKCSLCTARLERAEKVCQPSMSCIPTWSIAVLLLYHSS